MTRTPPPRAAPPRAAPALLAALALAACGGGSSAGPPPVPPALGSSAAIAAWLEGKTLRMAGADIPTHPFGFDEDVDYGASSQCNADTAITVTGGAWHVVTHTAALSGTPLSCSHAASGTTTADTTAVALDHVEGNGACLDVLLTFPGFTEAGRAAFSADGATLSMELFFGGRATGASCAAGLPGSGGVVLAGFPFTGNAVQVFRIR